MTNLTPITISAVTIQQDSDGRYRLNDLHKASGGEKRHQPANWLVLQQTLELIEELTTPGIPGVEQNQPVSTINGGSNRGTYVCKELVYAYAMWISAKFHLQVIRTFDAMVTQQQAKPVKEPKLTRLNPYREFKGYLSVAKLLGLQGNHAAIAANNAVRKLTGVNVLELIEHEHLSAAVQDPLLTPTEIAQRLGIGRLTVNPLLIETGLQTSSRNYKDELRYEITDKGKPYGVYLDTGKKHSDGTPVRQIKWYATVLNVLNHNSHQQEAA